MTEARDIRTIVVGVDGSDASVEALRQAQGLAGPLSATLVAMASWDVPPVYDGYVADGHRRLRRPCRRKSCRRRWRRRSGRRRPANVETRLVQGHPRHTLIEASRDADLVVVGRRGHGGFGGMLIGSVSSALVAHAHCPVLVVHSPETRQQKAAK